MNVVDRIREPSRPLAVTLRHLLDLKYEFAIFDVDGTLADSFPWFLRVVNTVADRHGFKRIEESDVEALRGKRPREIVGHLGVPMWKLPAIARDMRRLKAEHLDTVPLFPGVPQMLRDLVSGGVKLAIVSSDSEENVRRKLGPESRIVSYFACGTALFGKARKYRSVLYDLHIEKSDAVAIGDEVRDAEAAAKAGIDFAGVTWGYASAEALRKAGPVMMFERVDEIAQKLLGVALVDVEEPFAI